jgi:plasmid replication initiation protein
MARLKSKDEEIKGNLDQRYWVQKSDPLVLMRSVPFSLGELKVLDTYISRINVADDSRTTVTFTKDEYEKLMGISKINAEVLKKHAEGLLGKIVTLEMPNKSFLKFVLFTAAYYHLDDYGVPVIELSCSQQAKDLFFCIGKYHYFKYALENVINLTHKASYLLYIYVLHNRYRGEWELSLDELRNDVLDCKEQESYQEYKIFKNRVFDPAVKEVNKKTDCHFEYEAIRRGRKVAQIKFIYHSQQLLVDDVANSIPVENDESEIDWEQFYGSEQLAILAEGCAYEFNKEEMEQISRVLVRIHIPKDQMSGSQIFGKQFYLREKYAALNAEAAKKAKNNEKPIRNRFKYFLKMLEDDAFQPAAY